ncbi:MAG: acyltransferase family protein [Oscillospiraceae bacterium]|nr:acyltransferase family protein [Oscillospiraceae bacterium]
MAPEAVEASGPERLGKKRPRVYYVEFWRFAFTVILCLYHLEIFYTVRIFPSGTTAVEFFFILAGFTIAMTASNKLEALGVRELDNRAARSMAVDFAKKKLKAIYPVLTAGLILGLVVVPLMFPPPAFPAFGFAPAPEPLSFGARLLERIGVLFSSEWEWLMMVGSPMSHGTVGYMLMSSPIVPLWFLTPLFTIGYLYSFLMHRKYDLMMFLAPLIAVLGHIYFALNTSISFSFNTQMGFLDSGAMRAVMQMALGISMFQLYQYLINLEWTFPKKVFLQIVEIFAVVRFIDLTYMAWMGYDNFRRIPYVAIIVLLSFVKMTFISDLLDRKFMEWLGKISLTMFIIHQPLTTAYTRLMGSLSTMMMEGSIGPLPLILRRTAGTNEYFAPISLSFGDIVFYIGGVLVISIIINGIISVIKNAVSTRNVSVSP